MSDRPPIIDHQALPQDWKPTDAQRLLIDYCMDMLDQGKQPVVAFGRLTGRMRVFEMAPRRVPRAYRLH
jgi:hypothetical protein